MRLWLIHPKYLDCKGLVAVWREALLAKKVLQGRTKGYVNHPQLAIFKDYERSVDLINAYLFQIYLEAKRRGYSFDFSKIEPFNLKEAVTITSEQLKEEFQVLLEKLRARDKRKFEGLKNSAFDSLEPNPVFRVSPSSIQSAMNTKLSDKQNLANKQISSTFTFFEPVKSCKWCN